VDVGTVLMTECSLQILNVVAFVSDRSKPKDEREWEGPWLRKVDQETVLKDFEGWDQHYVELLKVRTGED